MSGEAGPGDEILLYLPLIAVAVHLLEEGFVTKPPWIIVQLRWGRSSEWIWQAQLIDDRRLAQEIIKGLIIDAVIHGHSGTIPPKYVLLVVSGPRLGVGSDESIKALRFGLSPQTPGHYNQRYQCGAHREGRGHHRFST